MIIKKQSNFLKELYRESSIKVRAQIRQTDLFNKTKVVRAQL